MKIFLAIVFSIGMVSTIIYATLALAYRNKHVGKAQISFDSFMYMYKTAPDMWKYNDYWEVLDYYPDGTDGFKSDSVRMSSYFDFIQLKIWGKMKEREKQKKKNSERRTKELYDSFYSKVLGKSDEHSDT